MVIVPLQATPSQTLRVVLGGQACSIKVYQKGAYVYLDLALPVGPLLYGSMCLNRVRIVREAYLGFIGDLAFVDTQGNQDPYYAQLGTRYALVYLAPEEITA